MKLPDGGLLFAYSTGKCPVSAWMKPKHENRPERCNFHNKCVEDVAGGLFVFLFGISWCCVLKKTSLGDNDYSGAGCHLIALQAPAPEVIAMALSEQCGFQSEGGN